MEAAPGSGYEGEGGIWLGVPRAGASRRTEGVG